MTVVFYSGIIWDDAYWLIVARFEVLTYATAALCNGRRKSFTEGEKGKIRDWSDCGLGERKIVSDSIGIGGLIFERRNASEKGRHLLKMTSLSSRFRCVTIYYNCIKISNFQTVTFVIFM